MKNLIKKRKEEFAKNFSKYDKDGGFIVYVEEYDNKDFDIDLIKQFQKQTIELVIEGVIKEINNLRYEHANISRHGNTADDAYDRIENYFNKLKNSK